LRRAVEFELVGPQLHLLYSPRDDERWVYDKFNRGETLLIKRTFHLMRTHLVQSFDSVDDKFGDDCPLRFKVAKARGDYFRFDPTVVQVVPPVLLHKDAKPTWKWFSSERSVSILKEIA